MTFTNSSQKKELKQCLTMMCLITAIIQQWHQSGSSMIMSRNTDLVFSKVTQSCKRLINFGTMKHTWSNKQVMKLYMQNDNVIIDLLTSQKVPREYTCVMKTFCKSLKKRTENTITTTRLRIHLEYLKTILNCPKLWTTYLRLISWLIGMVMGRLLNHIQTQWRTWCAYIEAGNNSGWYLHMKEDGFMQDTMASLKIIHLLSFSIQT